jgi:hypothetical protein
MMQAIREQMAEEAATRRALADSLMDAGSDNVADAGKNTR